MNHDWHVAGIIESGKLARMVVRMPVLQDLDASTGKVSQIYVKVDDPANIDPVVEELHCSEDSQPHVYTMDESPPCTT